MKVDDRDIEVVISPNRANVFAFILFIMSVTVYGAVFVLVWDLAKFLLAWQLFLSNYIVLFGTLLGGMVLHELGHALTWAVAAKAGWKSIKFGMNWKQLAPYTTCNEFLRRSDYIKGVMAPGIVLGIIPAVVACMTGSGWTLCFSVFFTAGAAGDFYSIYHIMKFKSSALICDHPTHLGFIARVESC